MRMNVGCIAAGLILLAPAWAGAAAAKSSHHAHSSPSARSDKHRSDKSGAKTKAQADVVGKDAEAMAGEATDWSENTGEPTAAGEGKAAKRSKSSKSSDKAGSGTHKDQPKKSGYKA